MDLVEKLKEAGWILSPEGYQTLTEDGKLTDIKAIEKKALDLDLCELGGCSFPSDILKGKESIQGDIVVQIKKVRNISAPKINQESSHAPRMLKLLLTDGTQVVAGVEMNHLPINLNTPPGTKLRLKGEITIKSSILLIFPSNVENLGGNVAKLVEKWKINQSFANHTRRSGVQDGPPPWIPFGQKLIQENASQKVKISPDDKDKEIKEDGEFEAQRRDAIAEAKTSTKKVFGGGTKPIVDKNMQALMEKGFTLQEAQGALKQNKNFDRALKNLQKKTGKGVDEKDKVEKDGKNKRKDNDQMPAQKPTSTILLYQYVKDSLPGASLEKEEEKEKPKEWEPKPQNDQNYRNKSFNYEKRGGGRGSHHNSGNDRRTKEPSRWQGQTQNQKPPRFQNQNKKTESEHFDYFVPRNDNAPSSSFRNVDNYFSSKTPNSSNTLQFNGHRNYFKTDNINYNQSSGSSEYRNQNSFMKPSGMPDIPEFPYKDKNAFMPMVPMNNASGFNNRINTTNGTAKPDKPRWQVGDKCLAKYWEDNEHYKAEVTAVSKTTCVVRFLDYGNFEEVLKDDCFPLTLESNMHNSKLPDDRNTFNGVLEFRKGGRSPYIKTGENLGPRKNQRYSQPVYMPPPGRNVK